MGRRGNIAYDFDTAEEGYAPIGVAIKVGNILKRLIMRLFMHLIKQRL